MSKICFRCPFLYCFTLLHPLHCSIISIMTLSIQFIWLFTLALPIACIAWTVTREEVFREPREYCIRYSKEGKSLLVRKFFYLFTCEYCFSHYVTILMLVLTGYKLLMDNWMGYVIAGFALVWMANVYMNLFALIKIDIKKERLDVTLKEEQLNTNNNSQVPKLIDVITTK